MGQWTMLDLWQHSGTITNIVATLASYVIFDTVAWQSQFDMVVFEKWQ